MPDKPILRSEDDARAAVAKWRGKPEHTIPKPGQEEQTRSDDYGDPRHHEPESVPVTDPPDDV